MDVALFPKETTLVYEFPLLSVQVTVKFELSAFVGIPAMVPPLTISTQAGSPENLKANPAVLAPTTESCEVELATAKLMMFSLLRVRGRHCCVSSFWVNCAQRVALKIRKRSQNIPYYQLNGVCAYIPSSDAAELCEQKYLQRGWQTEHKGLDREEEGIVSKIIHQYPKIGQDRIQEVI